MQSIKELYKTQFGLPKDGFLEPIDLNDTDAGFSVYKEREKKGFKSLFRIYIKNEDLKSSEPLKPVIVTASYGKETENGIILSSTDFKRSISWPIELISEDDFFYNIQTQEFFHKKSKQINEKINGLDILKLVDRWHIKTTRPVGGFWLRTKLIWFHVLLTFAFKLLFDIFSWIQYLISGDKVRIFEKLTEPKNYSRPNENELLKTSPGQLISIFGYNVKPWIAVLYSIFHLLVYSYFYTENYKPAWLAAIFNNNFLVLMYVIPSLGFANIILPILFKPGKKINGLLLAMIQSQYLKYSFKKLKI